MKGTTSKLKVLPVNERFDQEQKVQPVNEMYKE